MGAISKLESFDEIPNLSLKRVMFTLANTSDAADTFAITLSDYGIAATGLLAVNSWVHTADGSIITVEANTTSVTTGTLTVTIAAGTNDEFSSNRNYWKSSCWSIRIMAASLSKLDSWDENTSSKFEKSNDYISKYGRCWRYCCNYFIRLWNFGNRTISDKWLGTYYRRKRCSSGS